MRAWRIASARFPQLDGRGAERFGGRWNSPGRPLVYASSTLSLAMLELLARLPTGEVPADFVRIAITIPADVPVETVEPEEMPGWNAPDRGASRAFGDAWLAEGRTAVLLVPAVAVPEEKNVLINPRHPESARIGAAPPAPVVWDRRLFERP